LPGGFHALHDVRVDALCGVALDCHPAVMREDDICSVIAALRYAFDRGAQLGEPLDRQHAPSAATEALCVTSPSRGGPSRNT
jgi:hypothetical protein